jgi:hypothetical protein
MYTYIDLLSEIDIVRTDTDLKLQKIKFTVNTPKQYIQHELQLCSV